MPSVGSFGLYVLLEIAFDRAVIAAGLKVAFPERTGGKRWHRTLKSYSVEALARDTDEKNAHMARKIEVERCIGDSWPRQEATE